MANFKGGFAFNNGPAKVVVEQAPDGTLVSCVNPVTGESLNAENSKEEFTGFLSGILRNSFGSTSADIITALQNGDISANIAVNASVIGADDFVAPICAVPYTGTMQPAVGFVYGGVSEEDYAIMLATFQWTGDTGASNLILINENGISSLMAYIQTIPCTLTIYHHPMP